MYLFARAPLRDYSAACVILLRLQQNPNTTNCSPEDLPIERSFRVLC